MQTVANTREETFLSPKQAAHELGLHVSAIYRAVDRGELAVVRLGERGAIRIPRSALEPEPRP